MNTFVDFLVEIASLILSIVGRASPPLIVLLIFRAGRLRGLTEENMAERLGDLCFDTIKESLNNKISELLSLYFGNNFRLPRGLTIQQLTAHLHQDAESVEQLCNILKSLSEAGVHSPEFQPILLFCFFFY
jgi:hypothetical protein